MSLRVGCGCGGGGGAAAAMTIARRFDACWFLLKVLHGSRTLEERHGKPFGGHASPGPGPAGSEVDSSIENLGSG